MNLEFRYPVNVSLYVFHETKKRLEQVMRGLQLLRRKCEAMKVHARSVAKDLLKTQDELGQLLKESYISMAAAKFSNGEFSAFVLENVSTAQLKVVREKNMMVGVGVGAIVCVEGDTEPLPLAGLSTGGHQLAAVKKQFRQAARASVRAASLRQLSELLRVAIVSTTRKVNGIEKVIIPKLNNTIKYITTEMDEREREEFHRLKKVKSNKVKSHAAAMKKAYEEHVRSKGDFSGQATIKQDDKVIEKQDNEKLLYNFLYPTNLLTSVSSLIQSSGESACSPPRPPYWDDEDVLF